MNDYNQILNITTNNNENPFNINMELSLNKIFDNNKKLYAIDISQYIMYDNTQEYYLNSLNNQYNIKFKFNNKGNFKKINNTNYFNMGKFSLVYIINHISGPFIKSEYKNKNLILKIFDTDIDTFINKYKNDMKNKILSKYLPDIMYYGLIFCNKSNINLNLVYIIEPLYDNSIIYRSITNKITFLKNILIMLNDFNNNLKILNDFKLENISIKEDLSVIIIDYDETTIDDTLKCYTYLSYDLKNMIISNIINYNEIKDVIYNISLVLLILQLFNDNINNNFQFIMFIKKNILKNNQLHTDIHINIDLNCNIHFINFLNLFPYDIDTLLYNKITKKGLLVDDKPSINELLDLINNIINKLNYQHNKLFNKLGNIIKQICC